ncbi:MAG: hypothetical protein FWE35_22705 [Streptosporangiales bacterium]|jgi:hypothetical protein|nr:hypothetical protein [Streptosporangiales bacterium]
MHPRVWTAAGWLLGAAAFALVLLGFSWNWLTSPALCPAPGPGGMAGSCVPPVPGYADGLALIALGVAALFGSVGCFFWAAHRRVLDDLCDLLDSRS